MTRRDAADGTPSEDEVEHDFTVPADADLRPAPETEPDGDES
ncbi:hypothetical protein [uncultured Amnibacterium sp.]